MRTREIFKYLAVMIMALNTSVNAMAQQRNLKVYFNQYVSDGVAPTMLVTDDYNKYDLPAGLTYSYEGVAWAKEARFFEWINQDVADRLIADYVTNNGTVDKKNSHLKISFGNFPYEVNGIQWNVMNDLLSGGVTDFFKNYNVTTKCTPVSGSGFTYTEEHWAMNIFTHSTSFNQGSIPWKDGAILNGLKSFELSEKYFVELGIGSWTFWNLGQSELSSKCRTFIKAGWNGTTGANSNIEDGDDSNWAFKVTFTLPEIRVRNSRDLYVGDANQIEGYISAHLGAVVLTTDPTDPDRFHFEYETKSKNITITPYTGVIQAKEAGDANITVKLMRGPREVCSYTYELTVLEKANDPSTGSSTAEICLVFANGNKGYDLTVGDTNGKIQGEIVSVYGGSINVTNNVNGYHYEYESANTDIATIDQYGNITPKKEGDVEISAVLKNGNTVVSNTYTYTLHVFAPNEGMDWSRKNTYSYSYTDANNKGSWVIKNFNNTPNTSIDWTPTTLLKTDTYIRQNESGSDNNSWKEFAAFTTPSVEYYRTICQKIELAIRVPKYSKATATYKLAGNVTLGSGTEDAHYGFEIKDLGVVSSDAADDEIKTISLNTSNGDSYISTPKTLPTLIRKGVNLGYNAFMGAASKAPMWEVNNSDNGNATSEIRYLAIMAYLSRTTNYNGSTYSADASFGYKDIPTYTYYSHIYYHKNTYNGEGYYKDEELYSESKTGTMQLNNSFSAPPRTGYTFLGWSEDPNSTSPEYMDKDEFCSYDAVNGGGKGPIHLYAIWRPNTYTVTLDHNDGTGATEQVYVVYGGNMPLVDTKGNPLNIPTRDGYVFLGYGSPNNYYYSVENGKLVSYRTWPSASNGRINAQWEKTYTVTLNANGGVLPNPVVQENIGNFAITQSSNSVITIQFKSGEVNTNMLVHSEAKKPGYELLGWFDSNGVKVIEVDINEKSRNCIITDNGGYWTNNGTKFNYTDDLILTAYYRKKYKYADNIITYGKDENGNPEKVEAGEDWLWSVVNDLVGAAKEVYETEPGHPQTMVFDLKQSINKWTGSNYDCQLVMDEIHNPEYSEFISPNALVYFNENSYNNIDNKHSQFAYNAITADNKCLDLYVTDRYQMKIPHAFNAAKATYERNKDQIGTSDGMWEQSKSSVWGTLCLPYPIKNYNTHKESKAWDADVDCEVVFYELRNVIDRDGSDNDLMQFYKLPEDAVIPANTPVLYERTIGKNMGSAIIIEEISEINNPYAANIQVPSNPNFEVNTKSYANASVASIHNWEFRGSLKNEKYCGVDFSKTKRDGTEIEVDATGKKAGALPGYIYYFKQDQFTRLANNGRATVYPYRGFFYYNPSAGNTAKNSYSILVVDEDGFATDITETLNGNGEGDGKIYDLNGIRVMNPVKGRLYIVNGKKKVY